MKKYLLLFFFTAFVGVASHGQELLDTTESRPQGVSIAAEMSVDLDFDLTDPRPQGVSIGSPEALTMVRDINIPANYLFPMCIEGYYHHIKGNNLWGCVYIGNDVFEYIEYSNGFPWTVFQADYIWVDKHFIQLQSIPMKSIVDNSLQVNQFISGKDVDSLNVHVFAPKSQWHGGLNCEILYFLENGDGEWKNVSVLNNVNKFGSLLDSNIMLPSQIKKIVLKIEPNGKRNIPHPAQTYGAYYDSYLYYLSSEIKIDKGAERIRVELPELCGFDFGPYFVNGEYVMVKKNKIIWRGQTFEKVGDRRPVDASYSIAVPFK